MRADKKHNDEKSISPTKKKPSKNNYVEMLALNCFFRLLSCVWILKFLIFVPVGLIIIIIVIILLFGVVVALLTFCYISEM